METRERVLTAGVAVFGILFLLWKLLIKGVTGTADAILPTLIGVGALVALLAFVKDWLERR